MNTRLQLHRKLRIAQRWEEKQAHWLYVKGARWIEGFTDPLGRDYRDWPEEHEPSYSTSTLSTLACRRIRTNPANFGEQMILVFVRAHIRAAGLEKVLQWLDELRKEVNENTSPTRVLESVAMMEAALPGHCYCSPERDDDWWQSPALIWVHQNHVLYNKAIWEILASQPGLLHRVRRALRDDLRGPDRTIGDGSQIFGRHLDKTYANQLLDFITPQPTNRWVFVPAA